jgi:hypothetical protein
MLRALESIDATLGAGLCAALLVACPPPGGGGDAGGDGGFDASDASEPLDAPPQPLDGGADALDASVPAVDGGALPDAGALEAAVAPDGEAGAVCGFDAGVAPDGAPMCGDGWRDPATEECDDGLGAADPTRRACSAQCRVLDELAVWQADGGGLANAPRALGGRHPIAASDSTLAAVYLEPGGVAPALSLALFGARGAATGTIVPFAAQGALDDSAPVVAGMPCGRYAVAWTSYGGEAGEESDVAIDVVDPGALPPAAPSLANTTRAFAQSDPDVVWTGSQLVVAWVDASDATNGPDLRYRTFDSNLNPTSAEQTLAAGAGAEADVALTAFAGAWAAAWRVDAAGLETVGASAGGASWSVAPAFLPAPVPSKPALTPLDATHLLLVYAVGVDDADSGVAAGSALAAAVLDLAAPGPVTGVALPALAQGASRLDPSGPAAATVQGQAYVAWWTAAALGDPSGEDTWLKAIGWSGSALDLSSAEIPLPRWAQARLGDQEAPALAASALPPGGALLSAWNDLGRSLSPGEGTTDVVMELIPAPPLRAAGDGGP